MLAAEVSVANPAVPRGAALRASPPQWMVGRGHVPAHLPELVAVLARRAAHRRDGLVDAVTRDGRHVDPYNEVGSRVADVPVDRVPVRLGHDSFWCDYTLRIPDAGVYHQAFLEWVLRYPERTGNPNDTIASFDA